jgi:NAD(P)-dependent dehydrogenase (short-subunit alcohol dehydrogenase family)
MRLSGKHAIITGSGNGIGKATALLFASEGASVTVAELERDDGEQTATEIASAGGNAQFVHVDISDEDSVREMVAAAADAFGPPGVLVNNAAAFVFGGIEEITDADWAKVLGVNVIGTSHCVRHVLPYMRSLDGASIVNIASVSSFIAQPEFIPYNASKGAVLQLTRCLAMDLAREGIRVNAICPGSIKTRATDHHIASLGLVPDEAYMEFGQDSLMKRMGEPAEIASGALFLASDESSFMTGAHIVIDGGATID